MPRSIYEKKRAGLPLGTYPDSNREGWAYIGETVTTNLSADPGTRTTNLLSQAVWLVSAQSTRSDRLIDLFGTDRDAIFGPGAAAPVVLRHDGEQDYLYIPDNAGNGVSITTSASLPFTATRMDGTTVTGITPVGAWVFSDPGEWRDIRTDNDAYIMSPGDVAPNYLSISNSGSAGGTWNIGRSSSGFKTVLVDRSVCLFGGGQYAIAPNTKVVTNLPEWTVVSAFRAFGNDTGGVQHVILGNKTGGTTAGFNIAQAADIFSLQVGLPHRISYMGQAEGQHWSAIRADQTGVTGFVDDEMVHTATPLVPSDASTDLHIGKNPSAGFWWQGEFLSAAIFDRSLDDGEIQEVAASLLENNLGWMKVSVWNNVSNNWVQLNADLVGVDYALRDLKHDRVRLEIHDHLNFDYLDYSLTVTPAPANWTNPVTIPDDAQGYSITGLAASTRYTVNLVANLLGGGTTPSSTQSFTTPENPVPLAPLELSSPSRTNSWIDLEWKLPPGSTATTHNIYRGVGTEQPVLVKSGVVGLTARIAPLNPDTKYFYYVTGVNATGLEGPRSNVLKWATGHDETRRSGSGAYHMHPLEFGSWRPDIGWCDWHYWPRRVNQDSIFQGFWIADHRRYYGSITYQTQRCRVEMDQRFGAGVWQNIRIESVSLRRFYRMRTPGNAAAQWMQWYMTSTNIFDWGRPPLIGPAHINNRDDADRVRGHYSMAAGTAIDWLRMPREFAWSLLKGSYMGTAVNGIVLHRGDSENNGYGYAGYGEWCGHGQIDRHINEPWRFSDLSLHFQGSWNFVTQGRVAPYRW